MNIRNAKLNGIRAAAEVHRRLGLDRKIMEGAEYIDVFEAIKDLEIPTLCRPLKGLLGAYTKAHGGGILVTTQRRLPIQRFTAAHELGHHWLDHADSKDSEQSISLARQGIANVPLQEIEAEAFASEFLLPKSLLFKTAKRMGWGSQDLQNPETVYQFSLRTATSYEATWRALREANYITAEQIEILKNTAPKSIKEKIWGDYKPDDSWANALCINEKDSGSHIIASPVDTVLVDLKEHSSGGYEWSDITNTDGVQVLSNEVTEPNDNEDKIGSVTHRKVFFKGDGSVKLKMNESRPWEQNDSSATSFEITIDFNGTEEGIPRAAR